MPKRKKVMKKKNDIYKLGFVFLLRPKDFLGEARPDKS